MTEKAIQSPATYLEPELIDNLHKRLNRIEGHVRGISRMLNDQEDCESILIQLSAIKAAVNQVTIKALQGHIETCVAECAISGDIEALDRLNRAMALVLKNA